MRDITRRECESEELPTLKENYLQVKGLFRNKYNTRLKRKIEQEVKNHTQQPSKGHNNTFLSWLNKILCIMIKFSKISDSYIKYITALKY